MGEEVDELKGHLIDSFILPKVLDRILMHNACYEIQKIRVGIIAEYQIFARILVSHRDPRQKKACSGGSQKRKDRATTSPFLLCINPHIL
jgi:hypothetical protein